MKFREFITKAGTQILAGRNSESNESLIEQVKPNEEVFHTANPGSPFVNIKEKSKRGDIKYAAIFCAAYSQDWRDNKKDIIIHRFKGRDVYKTKGMKVGTFGVKRYKTIKVKKSDILKFKKERLLETPRKPAGDVFK